MNRYGIPTDVIIRLLAGVLLGAIVGVEREASEQSAGLRTHVAVCLGATLFGVVSTTGFDEFVALHNRTNFFNVDPTRVASNVAVGVGFLGAGVIFREGSSVHNLTTAASLWAVAAIGLAAGVGDIGTAVLATGLTVGYLVLLKPVRRSIRERARASAENVVVVFEPGIDLAHVHHLVDEAPGLTRADIAKVDKQDGSLRLHLALREPRADHRHDIERFLTELVDRPDVRSLERH